MRVLIAGTIGMAFAHALVEHIGDEEIILVDRLDNAEEQANFKLENHAAIIKAMDLHVYNLPLNAPSPRIPIRNTPLPKNYISKHRAYFCSRKILR